MTTAKLPPCPTESIEQQQLMAWAALEAHKYPCLRLLHAIPNGGKRGKVTAAIMQAEGVKRGVPDLFLPVPRGGYHGLYIEMKRQRGGQVSGHQVWWLNALREQGYRTAVCKGFEPARRVILDYLGGVKDDVE